MNEQRRWLRWGVLAVVVAIAIALAVAGSDDTDEAAPTPVQQSRMFSSRPLPVEIAIDNFELPLTLTVTDGGQVCLSAANPPANSSSCGKWDELGVSPGLFLEAGIDAGKRYSGRLVGPSHPVVAEVSAQDQMAVDVRTVDGSVRLVLILEMQ